MTAKWQSERDKLEAARDVKEQLDRARAELEHAKREGDFAKAGELQYGRIDELLTTGLHAYLVRFLERVHTLGGRIGQDFLATADA